MLEIYLIVYIVTIIAIYLLLWEFGFEETDIENMTLKEKVNKYFQDIKYTHVFILTPVFNIFTLILIIYIVSE